MATLCAALMVVTRVLTIRQLYRGIDWNTVILIGAMIAPAVAMTKTGAAAQIGDLVVGALGDAGPHVVPAGNFIVTAAVSHMVYGPGGYRFGDFWRLGLPVMASTLVLTVVIVPLSGRSEHRPATACSMTRSGHETR